MQIPTYIAPKECVELPDVFKEMKHTGVSI